MGPIRILYLQWIWYWRGLPPRTKLIYYLCGLLLLVFIYWLLAVPPSSSSTSSSTSSSSSATTSKKTHEGRRTTPQENEDSHNRDIPKLPGRENTENKNLKKVGGLVGQQVVRTVGREPTFERHFTQGPEQRYYLLHIPPAIRKQQLKHVPLLICYHGMTRTAWYTVNETGWIQTAEKHNFIVAYTQSRGEHTKLGGNTQWDADPSSPDVEYAQMVLEDILDNYGDLVDSRRVYAIGLSNGGIFISTLAILHSHNYAAVCNYMGGYVDGHNPPLAEAKRRIPMIIVVGSQDGMLSLCRSAEAEFKKHGHPVHFELVEGVGHVYVKDEEELIWSFLTKYHLE
jgi:predicted esterase